MADDQIRTTPAARFALLWLPRDGSWRMEEAALVEGLCDLRDAGDLAEEIQRTVPLDGGGFVHPWFWRLTPAGVALKAKELSANVE
jgi:hypothetical protein